MTTRRKGQAKRRAKRRSRPQDQVKPHARIVVPTAERPPRARGARPPGAAGDHGAAHGPGPLTATELADRLDETPANCSWHLRKLAEHDVRRGGRAAGRAASGPGRSARIGLSLGRRGRRRRGELRAGPRARADAARAARSPAPRRREPAPRDGDPGVGRRRGRTQHAGWLTPEELDELNAGVRAVLERYADRLTDPAQRPRAPGCASSWRGGALLLPGVEPSDGPGRSSTRMKAGLPPARLHRGCTPA